MLPLSDFLKLNKPSVITFIDEISNLNELSEAQVIRINDFYEEAGGNGPKSDNTTTPQNTGNNNKKEDFKEIHVQFENASCKYLAILNRLLNMHVPQMKAYLDEAAANNNNNRAHDCSEQELNGHMEKPKVDDSSFLLSLQRLVDILTGINGPSKK